MPGDRAPSVLFSQWYDGLTPLSDHASLDNGFWDKVLQVRIAVSRELEALRSTKTIGSSLDADVTLYCDDALLETLLKLGNELRFVLITSNASVEALANKPEQTKVSTLDDGSILAIVVCANETQKCDRCWHHSSEVGSHSSHPALCGRCVENIDGQGEARQHA